MERTISIAEFMSVIEDLPPNHPRVDPRVWYTTLKERWLGWLQEYDGPGGYGRIPNQNHDAKFAFNHVVNPQMLLWLIEAAGVSHDLVVAARSASENGTTMMQKSGIILPLLRKTSVLVGWSTNFLTAYRRY